MSLPAQKISFPISQKERPHWVKVTTQSRVVCSDYKSPYPLRHDWIDPMPENSTPNRLKLLDMQVFVCVCWIFITISTSVVNLREQKRVEEKRIERGPLDCYFKDTSPLHMYPFFCKDGTEWNITQQKTQKRVLVKREYMYSKQQEDEESFQRINQNNVRKDWSIQNSKKKRMLPK